MGDAADVQTWQDSPEPVNPGAPQSGDTNPAGNNAEGETAPQTWQDSPAPVNPDAPQSGDSNPAMTPDEAAVANAP